MTNSLANHTQVFQQIPLTRVCQKIGGTAIHIVNLGRLLRNWSKFKKPILVNVMWSKFIVQRIPNHIGQALGKFPKADHLCRKFVLSAFCLVYTIVLIFVHTLAAKWLGKLDTENCDCKKEASLQSMDYSPAPLCSPIVPTNGPKGRTTKCCSEGLMKYFNEKVYTFLVKSLGFK